ncbi:hypothetical protein [Paraburkholderia hospita]|uniref:hypothetical protein n=1 Tax=Paraburkholderia hospita TaxID=169430 RepID=UPI003ECDE87D
MSAGPTDKQERSLNEAPGLPPMFGPIENGKRTWIKIGKVDYDTMGYLLSCHLIIEHYMEAFLKAHHDQLDWEAARLTFGQQVALIATWNLPKPFNPIEPIKHLNTLRNRLGHRVDYRLTHEDMLPFIHYLQAIEDRSGRTPERKVSDEPAKVILERFTGLVAAAFAGSVSFRDSQPSRRGDKP